MGSFLAGREFEAEDDFFCLVERLARDGGELWGELSELALKGFEAEQNSAHVVEGDL